MNNIVLDSRFTTSIEFLENILFLDSFNDNKKIYNMIVNYLKKDNHYILKLNIFDLITKKYNSDIVIDVKELDEFNNCIKFGRRKYTSKG